MKKVYQTIVDNQKGNCMQAAIASLFDLELSEVPNFIEFSSPNHELMKFVKKRGFGYGFFDIHYNTREGLIDTNFSLDFIKDLMKQDGGINGYFYASVPSKVYEFPTTHAVIVDIDLNVVHDVNPKGLWLDGTAKDIIFVMTNKKGWYVQTNEDKTYKRVEY